MSYDAKKLLIAGCLATVVHTLIIYGARLFGLPMVDAAGALGSMFSQSSFPLLGHPAWNMGLIVHLFLGALLFPLLYGLTLGGRMHTKPVLCGVSWGAVLFCAGLFLVMPALGMTSYFMQNPLAILTYAIAHLGYGAAFGANAGVSMYSNLIPRRRGRAARSRRPSMAIAR